MTPAAQIKVDAMGWLAVLVCFAVQLLAREQELAHVVFSVCALILLWRVLSSSLGFWDPAPLYVAMSSLYVLSPALEVALLGNTLGFDPQRMSFLTDAGVAYLVAAGIAIAVLRRPQTEQPDRASDVQRFTSELETIGAACVALCAIYVVLVASRYGVSVGGIGRAELYADEFVLLSLTRLALVVGLMYALALLYRGRAMRLIGVERMARWLFTAAAVFIFIDLLVLGDRRMGVTLFLAAAPLFLPRRVKPIQLLGLLGVAVLLLLYSVVRNAPPSEWFTRLSSVDLLLNLSPAAAEFGIVAVIGGAVEDPLDLPADFPTYDQAFLQLLPRAILPDRPAAPSEWFVWHYFPDYAATGGSFAFSSVVEALGNGGLVGVVLAGLVAGAVLSLIARVQFLAAPAGVCFATFILVFSMRMELAAILRNAMYVVATMSLFLVLAAAVAAFRNRSCGDGRLHPRALTDG
jgi:hypothetical protein